MVETWVAPSFPVTFAEADPPSPLISRSLARAAWCACHNHHNLGDRTKTVQVLAADDGQTVGVQHGLDIAGKLDPVTVPPREEDDGAARRCREDLSQHEHTTGGEHTADLGQARRLVALVAKRHRAERQVEHAFGERQTLGAGMDEPDRQPGRCRGVGGLDHRSCHVDPDQIGLGEPLGGLPQQRPGAADDVQDPPRPWQLACR